MGHEIDRLSRQLAEFDAQQTPAGLLVRYARGRVRRFATRQILTLSGGLSLGVLVSPLFGLFAGLLALAGETLDCLYLRRVPRLLNQGVHFRRVSGLATLTAGLQAITISVCVWLAWATGSSDSAMFFCLAYLSGATVNAGITISFHRPSALARLGVFATTFLALFLDQLLHERLDHDHLLYDALGAVIMFYLVVVFLKFVISGNHRMRQNSRDVLRQGLELARVNASIRNQQAELRRLALVAQSAHDSVIMSDTAGQIIWVNDAFERVTGYSPQEAIGKTPGELLNGPDTSQDTSAEIAAAIAAGRSHRAEIVNYTKDGRRIWVETNLAPVLDQDGQTEMVVAIERDITAMKTHQEELGRAKRAAEENERAKSSFLASMSHEIRTPMNGIIGTADLLSELPLPDDGKLYTQTIKRSAQALLTIINDILDFSKLTADKLTLSPVPFVVEDLVHEVLNLLRPQADEKGLDLAADFGTTLPEYLMGDDVRIRQILTNVVGNAVKFTEAGRVEVRLDWAMNGQTPRLDIYITDTGVGIPEDRIEKIFDQFEQAECTTTRRFGGTGLGLAISRKLARNMDGDITATSTLGEGTCFHITLKLAQAENPAKTLSDAEDATKPIEINLEGAKVLLAEDNETNRMLVGKFLNTTGVDLITAVNGKQAVDMVDTHHPDIVLMDMSMPEMDGPDATRAIRQLSAPQPRIIALTANAYETDRKLCLSAGMDAFLTKPIRKQILIREITRQFEKLKDMPI
ncbi:MAG: ATP-binding protein [Pelagimonas sp.]|nr:ATP-binding protein [Pelagimonas sp.]